MQSRAWRYFWQYATICYNVTFFFVKDEVKNDDVLKIRE
jgi:hypothetical protein